MDFNVILEEVDIQCRRHLNDLLTGLGAIVIQNQPQNQLSLISRSNAKFDSEGQLTDEGLSSQVDKKLSTFIAQMDWYAIAIKNHKELYEPIPIR